MSFVAIGNKASRTNLNDSSEYFQIVAEKSRRATNGFLLEHVSSNIMFHKN